MDVITFVRVAQSAPDLSGLMPLSGSEDVPGCIDLVKMLRIHNFIVYCCIGCLDCDCFINDDHG